MVSFRALFPAPDGREPFRWVEAAKEFSLVGMLSVPSAIVSGV
jgi:hypothetical protein